MTARPGERWTEPLLDARWAALAGTGIFDGMLAHGWWLVGVVGALAIAGCKKTPDDRTIAMSMAGTWTWSPREQLPTEAIENDTGIYVTPDQQILEIRPIGSIDADRGDYFEYRHVPANKNMAKEAWVTWRHAPWYLADARVNVQGRLEDTFDVVRTGPDELRLKGTSFRCKDGCVLHRLKEIPAAAKSGLDRSGP